MAITVVEAQDLVTSAIADNPNIAVVDAIMSDWDNGDVKKIIDAFATIERQMLREPVIVLLRAMTYKNDTYGNAKIYIYMGKNGFEETPMYDRVGTFYRWNGEDWVNVAASSGDSPIIITPSPGTISGEPRIAIIGGTKLFYESEEWMVSLSNGSAHKDIKFKINTVDGDKFQ